jgi:hypothetical protein
MLVEIAVLSFGILVALAWPPKTRHELFVAKSESAEERFYYLRWKRHVRLPRDSVHRPLAEANGRRHSHDMRCPIILVDVATRREQKKEAVQGIFRISCEDDASLALCRWTTGLCSAEVSGRATTWRCGTERDGRDGEVAHRSS